MNGLGGLGEEKRDNKDCFYSESCKERLAREMLSASSEISKKLEVERNLPLQGKTVGRTVGAEGELTGGNKENEFFLAYVCKAIHYCTE